MRKLLTALGVGLGALLALIVVRTLLFRVESRPVPPAEKVDVDAAAVAARLAAALRIRTVTRVESPRFDPATFDALHAHLRAEFPLAHTRLSTETVNRHSLLFRWPGSDDGLRPMLLMAHQDVVPVDEQTAGDWTHPPFAGVVADGYIWGRGTLDVKQGVLGILEAVEMLLQAGFQPRRTIYLAFGHDEEIGGRDGARAIAELLRSRGVDLSFVVDEGGVLTRGIVPDVDDWVALIGVAEKGYVSLRLTARGEGGHSSMPPRQSAVGVVAKAVATLEAKPFPARTEGSKRFFRQVAPKMPFLKRMVFANMWLFEPLVVNIMSAKPSTNATLRTTTAATIIRGGVKDNVLPTRAEAVLNFRIMPGETPQSVKERVETVIDDERVEVEFFGDEGGGFGTSPSRFSSTESAGFVALGDTIREVAQDEDLTVAPYLVLGATDSRYFEPIADDVYRFLFNRFEPEDLERVHGIDERIGVDNYVETIRFYHQLIKRAAG